jgi:hypothetical protein
MIMITVSFTSLSHWQLDKFHLRLTRKAAAAAGPGPGLDS